MKFAILAALVAISAASLVTIPAPTYPCDWNTKGYVHPSTVINFTIALKEQNAELIHKIALDVSDPDSSNYGQYLTTQEIIEITAPKDSHVEAVVTFLKSHDIAFTRTMHQLEVSVNVVDAERLFRTVFYTVSHKASQQTRVHARKQPLWFGPMSSCHWHLALFAPTMAPAMMFQLDLTHNMCYRHILPAG